MPARGASRKETLQKGASNGGSRLPTPFERKRGDPAGKRRSAKFWRTHPKATTAAAALAEGQPYIVVVSNPDTLLRIASNQGAAPTGYISTIDADTGVYADVLASYPVYIPRTVTTLVAI
jgi:hypothetical protein